MKTDYTIPHENIHRTHEQSQLRYLRIHSDRMLTYKTQIESIKLRCKKELSPLKAKASKGIEQRHLFLLYQSVILSVIGYIMAWVLQPCHSLTC